MNCRGRDLVAFCLFLVLAAVGGCTPAGQQAGPTGPPSVTVSTPLELETTPHEDFRGRTEAPHSVEVRARVNGHLIKVNFEAGAEVKKGDLLFEIDPRPFKAALDAAEAQLAGAEASLQLAKTEYARSSSLARTGAASREEVDVWMAKQSVANAEKLKAKAAVEQAKLDLEYAKLTADIDGRISRNLIDTGNLVKADNTLLTTVVAVDPMFAYFDVDENTVLRIQRLIREGKIAVAREIEVPVLMGLANEGDKFPHKGTLNFVDNRIDPLTGSLQARGVFPNPLVNGSRVLSPGLSVRIRVPLGSPYKALMVTERALGTDQGQKYLYIVDDKNAVEYRPVRTGAQQPGGLRVIEPLQIVRTEGGVRLAREGEKGEDSLKPADRVIVSGLQRVRPGMTVDPKTAPMPQQKS